MKTVKVGNKEITIKFYYGRNNKSELLPNETKCTIQIEDSVGKIIRSFNGIARKHDQDMFCKEIARKKSLKSALKSCDDRFCRRVVWMAYLNR